MAFALQKIKYLASKVVHSSEVAFKALESGAVKQEDLFLMFYNTFQQKLTKKVSFQGDEMAPTFDAKQPQTLVIRKITIPTPATIFVGDVVIFNSPTSPEKELVRRVAAMEGEEMLSSDPQDESFCIEENHCWVLCDNQEKKAKEASDSRTFGPLPLSRIFGRALYAFTSSTDHGPVYNSTKAAMEDLPVMTCELREYISAQQEADKK